ncbi:MAG TPA: YraN family protein [Prolixibacteraceae bacterium]
MKPDKAPAAKDLLGKRGEQIALDFLLGNGYQILDLNWRWRRKEIDIVAKRGEEIVVVEVKTRVENFSAEPYESVTLHKIKNIVEVADHWLRFHKSDLDCRFDVISVTVKKDGSHALEHFTGAFTAPLN